MKKPIRTDRSRFWLYVTIVSAVIWALGGLLGALSKSGTLSAVAAVISGVGSCYILAGAVLSLAERRGRPKPGKTQRLIEIQLMVLLLALLVLAELIALSSGKVSYGPLATLGILAVVFCVWIAGPTLARHEKFDMVSILKIICLGSAATWLLAKYFSVVVEALQ